jgi:hypothetical protein
MRHASIQTTLNTYGGGLMECDVASSWPDRKASDCTLMDVNGRQHITNYREISNLMAERAGFEPKLFNKINQLEGANGTRNR